MADFDGPAVRVHEKSDEQLAVERELGCQVELAEVHPVVGIVPELVEELLHLGMCRGHDQPVAEHEVHTHFHDRVGERIGVIRLVALVVNIEIGGRKDVLLTPVVGEAPPVVVLFGTGGRDASPEPVFLRHLLQVGESSV